MCIDLHQTGSVVAGSDRLQLIKFCPREGVCGGAKIFGAQCLRLSERFFHLLDETPKILSKNKQKRKSKNKAIKHTFLRNNSCFLPAFIRFQSRVIVFSTVWRFIDISCCL